MFDRYTEDARNVVVVAQEEARALRHGYVGTEHLLLALLRLPREAAVAEVLRGLGLTVDDVRERLSALVPAGQDRPSGQLPFTPRAKRLLEVALREALSRGDRHVGAEHLLLATARADEDSVAMRLLQAYEVTPDQIRAAVATAIPAPSPGIVEARRRSRRVAMRNRRIGVDLSAEADRLLMSAGARALDDGRTLITISDLEEALRRWRDADDAPPESATG
jgi:ATP-dependent Clp protease ATP-binding subunit ClpA